MIAEVIPLRRRAHDRGWTPDEAESTHSGVFDPPPEPEPPEEYSVWERPTAELVRRQRPDDLVPVDRAPRRWPSVSFAHSGSLAAAVVALIATAGVLIALGQRQHHAAAESAARQLGAGAVGLGAPLGGLPTSTPRERSDGVAPPAQKARHRSPTRWTRRAHSTAQPSASGVTSPSAATPAGVDASREGRTSASQSAQRSPREPTAVAASASREFGFER